MYRKIDISCAAQFLVSEDVAKEFVDHRINKKSPLTQRAFDRAMMAAFKCHTLGITPDQAVEMTIDRGWQGITFEYIKKEISRLSSAHETNQRNSRQYQTRTEKADSQFETIIRRGTNTQGSEVGNGMARSPRDETH